MAFLKSAIYMWIIHICIMECFLVLIAETTILCDLLYYINTE